MIKDEVSEREWCSTLESVIFISGNVAMQFWLAHVRSQSLPFESPAPLGRARARHPLCAAK